MYDRTILEQRLAEIEAMPDGPEKDQAFNELAADYPELYTTARDDVTRGLDMYNTEAPGMREGPAGNPFAVTIAANPLEHLATGATKFMGGKQMREGRQQLDDLAEQKQRALSAFLRAGTNQTQQQPDWRKKRRWGSYGVF